MDNRQALATQNIGPLILKFSIPSVAGMLVNGLYSVVDRVFVGQGVGANALAGVAITFPLTMLVLAIGMLIGHGASAIISIRLGEGDHEAASRTVGTATTFALILGIAMATIVGVFTEPILRFFGGSGEILSYAVTFTHFYIPGIVLQVMSFSLNNMIRGQGDPVTALVTMLFSAGVNCILNPIFIMGFHWGIAGSAIATDISMLCSCTWLLIVYRNTKTGIRLEGRCLKPDFKAARAFLGIGIAPFAMQVAGVVSFIIANHQVARTGGDAGMTVLGISTAIVNLMTMPIIGVNSGVQPIIGFNYGAKQFGRVKKTLKLSMIGVCAICLVCYVLFAIFASSIVKLFVGNDPTLVTLGAKSLRMLLFSVPYVGLVLLSTGFFQSTKRGMVALSLNLLRQVVFLIPLYIVMPNLFGLEGAWIATPIADTLTTIVALCVLIPSVRKLGKEGEAVAK